MRICVIGAGAAGLAAVKRTLEDDSNHKCVVFEQNGEIGGTWVFNENVGEENGAPVHSSMYKNLRTNLPKEVMGFPDYKIPNYRESYITQGQILAFLNDYADHFNIRSHIKFYNRVKYIKPGKNLWQVTVTDLLKNEELVYEFDAVMVCNGHYHTPRWPQIVGKEIYKGRQMHSHDFRDVAMFKDLTVLVVGAGPSGMDIALQVSSTAKKVYLSHHSTEEIKTKFPKNLEQKPDISSMTETEIIFKDDSKVVVNLILYCTGYLYYFPFLDEKCGITVDDNFVQPLYKHLINVNYPTMCFIGLPFYVCAFSMFDLQVRFFLEFLKGNVKLPSKDEMLNEIQDELSKLQLNGLNKKHFHMLGPKQADYFNSLSSIAKIDPLPSVLEKLHTESTKRFSDDLVNFRKDVFQIIDDFTFIQVK